ncbi:MAG: hypothetical protein U0807_13385 [Candidatus Binatia bacterium]
MDAAHAGASPEAVNAIVSLTVLVAVTLGAGVLAQLLLEPGVPARSFPLLLGLVGLYAGQWLFEALDFPAGPMLAGHAVAPAFGGALAVAAIVKLAMLGVAGPRW